MSNPVINTQKRRPAAHGGGVRGDKAPANSALFTGRFGRIFRSLPEAQWPKPALMALGLAMTSEPERKGNLPVAAPETDDLIQDDEENAGIPAGYTYLGQFIDHDITFDPASSLQQSNDPNALVDFRTPQLDLDCLYGRGPDDQPYMFDGKKFRMGKPLFELDQATNVRDLPRYIDPNDPDAPRRALIGDKRNDENVIVSQLHASMMQFHNKLVDEDPAAPFAEIQQRVRWHYQWIVVNDFLMRICGRDAVHSILPHLEAGGPIWLHPPRFAFYHPRNDAFMPVEFAAAAYRFGHSMVRPVYRLNTRLNGGEDPLEATQDEKDRGLAGRFFIFAGVQFRGLNGFDEFPAQWAIDWSLYFDMGGSGALGGAARVQPSYKIDTALVNPLGFLPEFSQAAMAPSGPLTIEKLQSVAKDPVMDPSNLAQRNLLRGMALGLPSGQAVARAMGLDPIEDKDLKIGKAVVDEYAANENLLGKIHPSFAGKAPLWYYVLAEAQHEWFQRATAPGGKGDDEPVRLGAVGGRIVAETLIGILWSDGHSYLRQAPNWKPETIRTMGDLLQKAVPR